MPTKVCVTCELIKPLEDFHRRRDRPDGRQSTCKACHKTRQRTWKRPKEEHMGEIQLTDNQKRELYSGAVLRMYEMGLISKDTTVESLERIRDI